MQNQPGQQTPGLRELMMDGVSRRNPATVQMLGLCPLLAVSTSVVNAIGLAVASTFVLLTSSIIISLLRRQLPDFARLPAFMLIIAGSTTLTTQLLEAFAFDLYSRIALFVQIIVTNCIILGRAEAFASRQPVHQAAIDAIGTAIGFALVLILLGGVREMIGAGTLFARLDTLFGPSVTDWSITLLPEHTRMLIVILPPGAFIAAGLLLGLFRQLFPDDDASKNASEKFNDAR